MPRFNAHHAPLGAYASLTLGAGDGRGGPGMESGHPPHQDVVVAVGAGDRYDALPFFAAPRTPLHAVEAQREFGATSDRWEAGGLALRVLSPLRPVPEPGVADEAELRDALVPAVLVELTVDNRGHGPRRAAFGVAGGAPARAHSGSVVIEQPRGGTAGIFCRDAACSAAAAPELAAALEGPPGGSGGIAVLRFDVAAGELATYRIAVAFWHDGEALAGEGASCSYWYTRLFAGLDDAADYALEHFDRLAGKCVAAGAELAAAPLSDEQRFQLEHAIRSYYANTALLATDGDRPLWAVMEGEFEYVNTLDLTIDHVFFELRQNPWTVRNALDAALRRSAYVDRHGVGLSHDIGCFPRLADLGESAYEQPRRPGRRVLMTTEEVANWTLAALAYVTQSGDEAWAATHEETLRRCLESLVARDAGCGERADGVLSVETDRTGPLGEEITTYDSLDAALRQARRSSYLAVKQWAACVCLAAFLRARGADDSAAAAAREAQSGAATILAAAADHGRVPALLAADGEPADATSVIPVVEGLVYPLFAGAPEALDPAGDHGELLRVLGEHLRAVLVPGACLFADGGWKLSAGSDNSWLSKIYLAQFVARQVLGMTPDGRADAAHVAWLHDPQGAVWAWSDQILAGRIHSSRFYPRGVTAALWLEEHPASARLTAAAYSDVACGPGHRE